MDGFSNLTKFIQRLRELEVGWGKGGRVYQVQYTQRSDQLEGRQN